MSSDGGIVLYDDLRLDSKNCIIDNDGREHHALAGDIPAKHTAQKTCGHIGERDHRGPCFARDDKWHGQFRRETDINNNKSATVTTRPQSAPSARVPCGGTPRVVSHLYRWQTCPSKQEGEDSASEDDKEEEGAKIDPLTCVPPNIAALTRLQGAKTTLTRPPFGALLRGQVAFKPFKEILWIRTGLPVKWSASTHGKTPPGVRPQGPLAGKPVVQLHSDPPISRLAPATGALLHVRPHSVKLALREAHRSRLQQHVASTWSAGAVVGSVLSDTDSNGCDARLLWPQRPQKRRPQSAPSHGRRNDTHKEPWPQPPPGWVHREGDNRKTAICDRRETKGRRESAGEVTMRIGCGIPPAKAKYGSQLLRRGKAKERRRKHSAPANQGEICL
eukprot:GEMP01041362.1.p1 GENE.GEMP01041362.1~~GEMP01041362.1.p1  ORF type:complete len:389 (+),score=81.15 GEMP01041362.1:171-1337(+)